MKLIKNKGLLVCFIGIDGSGKTTLSKDLVKLLNHKGINSKYVYGRLKPILILPFMIIGRTIFLNKNNMYKEYTNYSDTKKRAFKSNSFLSTIYLRLLLLDYFLQLQFKIKIPLIFGKNIVCDRYVFDTIVTDLSTDMDFSYDMMKILIEKCFQVTPKPTLTFLIDLPEEVAFKRKDDVYSLEYLKNRRKNYLKLCRDYNMITLEGDLSLNKLNKIIHEKVNEYLQVGVLND